MEWLRRDALDVLVRLVVGLVFARIFPPHDAYPLIRKRDDRKVIDVMHHLVLAVDVVSGDVSVIKSFAVQFDFEQVFLCGVLAHQFEQDASIAMEDGIDAFGHAPGGGSQAHVVIISALLTTEYFIAAALQWLLTDFA